MKLNSNSAVNIAEWCLLVVEAKILVCGTWPMMACLWGESVVCCGAKTAKLTKETGSEALLSGAGTLFLGN